MSIFDSIGDAFKSAAEFSAKAAGKWIDVSKDVSETVVTKTVDAAHQAADAIAETTSDAAHRVIDGKRIEISENSIGSERKED